MAILIRNLLTPRSLLADPDRFGGIAEGEVLRGDLLVTGGKVLGFTCSAPGDARVVDGAGRILLPGLVEPHLHLDKAYTLPRLPVPEGGLLDAIAAQEADKANWTDADLRARALRALTELEAAGVSHARSHVDWGQGDDPQAIPRAWGVLAELAQDWRGRVELTLSCLPDIDTFADPTQAERIARAVAQVGGALGAWCLGHADRKAGFFAAFDLAARYGLALDFHVDEGLGPDLDGLDIITATALATRFQGPVLCSHAISLANRSGPVLERLLADMVRAGISLCALPTTNLHLQSRGGGTPDRRGITRLSEAAGAGVTTCLGTDNVQDAFYPLGRHDPLLTLASAVPAMHFDPPLGRHLPLVATQAAQALGVARSPVDRSPPGRLWLAEARDLPDLLARQAARIPLSAIIDPL
jgi:cytosine deaminase